MKHSESYRKAILAYQKEKRAQPMSELKFSEFLIDGDFQTVGISSKLLFTKVKKTDFRVESKVYAKVTEDNRQKTDPFNLLKGVDGIISFIKSSKISYTDKWLDGYFLSKYFSNKIGRSHIIYYGNDINTLDGIKTAYIDCKISNSITVYSNFITKATNTTVVKTIGDVINNIRICKEHIANNALPTTYWLDIYEDPIKSLGNVLILLSTAHTLAKYIVKVPECTSYMEEQYITLLISNFAKCSIFRSPWGDSYYLILDNLKKPITNQTFIKILEYIEFISKWNVLNDSSSVLNDNGSVLNASGNVLNTDLKNVSKTIDSTTSDNTNYNTNNTMYKLISTEYTNENKIMEKFTKYHNELAKLDIKYSEGEASDIWVNSVLEVKKIQGKSDSIKFISDVI